MRNMRHPCTAAKKRRFIVSALLLPCLLIALAVAMTSARAAAWQKQTGSTAGQVSWRPSEREEERGVRGPQGPQRLVGLQAPQGFAGLPGSQGPAGLAWSAEPPGPAMPCTICDVPNGLTPAALSLSKTGVHHGDVITYTLLPSIVGNTGLAPSGTVIMLTDTLPAQETLIPGSVVQSFGIVAWTINISGNTLTETLTAPAAGIAAGTVLPSITFDALINAGTKTGTIIENEATISAPGFAPVSASSTIELREQHECPHMANWGCEHECPHVANWGCLHIDDQDHNRNHNANSKNHSGNSNGGKRIIIIKVLHSDPKIHSSHSSSADSKNHCSPDARSHSGSNGGKQIIIVKESKATRRSIAAAWK